MWTYSHFRKTLLWYYDHKIVYNILSKQNYIKWKFRKLTGYSLSLTNPKTFCEKIQWLKFNMIREDFTKMVDKVDAKSYVRDIIGDDYIIPTYGVWNNLSEVEWEKLPNQFVIKLTNDSGGIVVCKDKSTFDKSVAIQKLSKKKRCDYSKYNAEYPYHGLQNRIIAEKLLVNENDPELKDYKFFCFNGKAKFCQVIADRTTNETIDFYDRKWAHQEFIGLLNADTHIHKSFIPHERPENYLEMCKIADKIASEINTPFVRIDLYNANNKIYFGEITFFPASGMGHIVPAEWDYKLGNMIHLPNV